MFELPGAILAWGSARWTEMHFRDRMQLRAFWRKAMAHSVADPVLAVRRRDRIEL